jgi:hypothetical protein
VSTTDTNVLIACATVVSALLGIIGSLLLRILTNTRRTHEQVANNHYDDDGNPINMRDDLDEIRDLVRDVADTQKTQGKEIGGIRAEIRQVRADQSLDRAAATRAADSAARAASSAAQIARQALERTKPKHPTQGEDPQ